MHWVEIFHRFKRKHSLDPSDQTSHLIDEVISSDARRVRSVDPETNERWRQLKTAMARIEVSATAQSKSGDGRFLRPSIAFVTAALLIAIGIVWMARPSTKTYQTAKGEHATIALPDSTEVTLNYTSALSVRHAAFVSTRQVVLQGEGFFDVRHNGTPFIVSTEIGTIRVLGTQFDVRVREEQLEVGVVRGSVQVTVTKNGVDTSLILTKNQIVVCTKSGFEQRPETLPFPDYPGWMHGRLMFYRTDFGSACRELESQFGIIITIRNPRLRAATITGIVDGQNVETALSTLAQLTGSNFRREGSGYALY